MAATVLNSKRAIDMSVFVVRAFVRMREVLAMNQEIMTRLQDLEERVENHDVDIRDVLEAIRELMTPPAVPRRRIGFQLPGATPSKLSRAAR